MVEINGEEYESEDDYLDTLKLGDSYYTSIDFEYQTDDGDWASATMEVEANWSDWNHGYEISYSSDEESYVDLADIFDAHFSEVHGWLQGEGISDEVISWP